MTNPIWERALRLLIPLRPAFSRQRSFLWFVIAVCAMLFRQKTHAVTGMTDAIGGSSKVYFALLRFFASSAVSVPRLARLWSQMLLNHPQAARLNDRVLLVVDGIKAPRSGLRMPAAKRLFQSSSSNTKPEYIRGHSIQSLAMLLRSLNGVSAVPLMPRILEGLKETPRDLRSQLDTLPDWLGVVVHEKPFYLVADAYYASGAFAKRILKMGGHLITRARSNAVAYEPSNAGKVKQRGRPQKYGKKVALKKIANDNEGFVAAEIPIYGEERVMVRYKEVTLLWKPAGGLVKFILAKTPSRGKGTIILMTTDLTMKPEEVIMAYGLRFKIEVSFKSAVHTIGSFAYHFWTKAMPKRKRNDGTQYTHRLEPEDRERVWDKFESYHVYLQVAAIAQGITQLIAAEMPEKVLAHDTEFRRTVIPLPSEATVKSVLHKTCRIFFGLSDHPDLYVNQMQEVLNELYLNNSRKSSTKDARYA
jgi:hypothetical protein